MDAFIHRGKVGFWTSNAERDAFLDWFAEARCSPEDPRRAFCHHPGNRWMGCGLDLVELLPEGVPLRPTAAELEAARVLDARLVPTLKMVEAVTSGSWRHGAESEEAVWWPVPWFRSRAFTEPGVWSEDGLDLDLDFARPDAETLVQAVSALWSHPHLQGCWLENEREPTDETRLAAPYFAREERARWGPPEFEGPPTLYGFARVHGRHPVPCAAYSGLGDDYMFLSLSFRAPALRRWLPPHGEPEGAGGPKMFAWLTEIGRHVHATVPIRCAVIGWEPTLPKEPALRRREFQPTYGYLLPGPGDLEFIPPRQFSPP